MLSHIAEKNMEIFSATPHKPFIIPYLHSAYGLFCSAYILLMILLRMTCFQPILILVGSIHIYLDFFCFYF